MQNSDAAKYLNHLVEINKDAEAGFVTAAENVKNSELESLLTGYAKQHAKFASELQDEVERLGGKPPDSGTVGGAVHRGWMDVKSAFTGGSAAAMLSACENGEQSADSAYLDAEDTISSGQTHTLLTKQREQISAFRTRLTRLLGEIKDGVEFQKNE
jgi:uncharacterized protein (TIGR02284 family)